MLTQEVYEELARLLEYPSQDWNAPRVSELQSRTFGQFVAAVNMLSLVDLQELYTRTFDLNPVCALEVGYHLFGENYKRGEFMANLRETEEPFDLGQQNQLPDYLPVLLRLIPKLKDVDLRDSLIVECLIPAIEKMLASFSDSDNPYRFLLETVNTGLKSETSAVSVQALRLHTRPSLPIINERPFATRGELF